MTLSRKMMFTGAILILGLIVLGVICVWGVTRQQQNFEMVVEEFEELRIVGQVERDVVSAMAYLDAEAPKYDEAIVKLNQAVDTLEAYLHHGHHSETSGLTHFMEETAMARAAHDRLLQVLEHLKIADVNGPQQFNLAMVASMNDALAALEALVHHAGQAVASAQQKAGDQIQRNTLIITIAAVVIALLATVVSISQYRSVVRPLHRLREGVRNVAAGRLSQRLETNGDREFAELANDFNRMAAELDGLYKNLEAKVVTKSRELVRSERLASVGFLAAGLAHELNNPLGIISGYAELSLKQLQQDRVDAEELKQSLRLVRDEAFRCKQMIQRLLSLSRMRPEARTRVDVTDVAEDVASMIAGLEKYRDRHLTLSFDDSKRLIVKANPTELKQVLLNLTVNALEATAAGDGQATILGRENDGLIELIIEDNGCGMSETTIEHIFEPFFSKRRGPTGGTGLGLSVTLAIVENHGGRIEAHSDGPGLGSRFIVQLPAAESNQRPNEVTHEQFRAASD